ncbi:hypothetical protein [Burkholderia gladioli]|uniref:hypothetical protein n=1 Tax=Burkholderia gladioli TaxID=28095 RepID=UPI001641FD05|nr:hypothetical protein [Burkholderia gladioli]
MVNEARFLVERRPAPAGDRGGSTVTLGRQGHGEGSGESLAISGDAADAGYRRA